MLRVADGSIDAVSRSRSRARRATTTTAAAASTASARGRRRGCATTNMSDSEDCRELLGPQNDRIRRKWCVVGDLDVYDRCREGLAAATIHLEVLPRHHVHLPCRYGLAEVLSVDHRTDDVRIVKTIDGAIGIQEADSNPH